MQERGFLLVADISGYTEFVRLHNLRKKSAVGAFAANIYESHAEAIVSDLLEAVIEAIEPTMKLNKLEGDAAFFHVDETANEHQADDIYAAMERAQAAFQKKANALVFVQACGCEPCMQSKNLRLKIVVHHGNYLLKTIRQFEEIAGETVIFVHRMLKNNINSNEYWLVSEEFSQKLSAENAAMFSKVTEDIDGFGKTDLDCLILSTPDPENDTIKSRSWMRNWFRQLGYFVSAPLKRGVARK